MKILSIETSCDETGISILECSGGLNKPSFNVLANNLNSQIKIHAPYGGVFPALAKREHIKNLPILLEKTLKDSKLIYNKHSKKTILTSSAMADNVNIKNPGIDLIVVTHGPGLEPALWTGIVFAKELGESWKIPVIGINHMEGHMLSVFGKNKGNFKIPKIQFPAISLLVSGGHTELVVVKEWMNYKIIGETLDDAAGEAFDKVARMLGLPYPGGPEISKLAAIERKSSKNTKVMKKNLSSSLPEIKLPRPMLYSKNFNFSFSGLKTAVLYLIKKIGTLDEKIKMQIAMEFENAVAETLVYKTKKAMEKYNIKTVIVAGGVSSNKHLRNEIKKIIKPGQDVLFPNKDLSTDNSIMIGMVGYFRFLKNKPACAGRGKKINTSKIKAFGGLRL